MNSPSFPVAVEFSGTSLSIIHHDGKPWLAAADLARALGYQNSNSVSRIYARHSGEFSDSMTGEVKLTLPKQRHPVPVRIFSPRGCHLIAMFAHTPRAAEFRRWVLDVLEALVRPPEPTQPQPQRIEVLAPPPDMITEPAKGLLAAHLLALLDRFGATPQVIAELDRQGQLPPPKGFQQKLRGLRYQTRLLAKESARLARVADELSQGIVQQRASGAGRRTALAEKAIADIQEMLAE